MGDVYLARSGGLSGFNKLVVIKTLKLEFAEDEKFREMFLDEARLAARLNHRNIVQTNDVGEADGLYFLVMEFLDGRSLAALLKRAEQRAEPLPLAVRMRVIAEMLAGLHHAHELTDYDGKLLSVVHRDVCPANVLVSFDGQVRVVDFGVAKAKNQSHETQAGTIKGRVAYMSPEHVNGKGLDRRADIFSAGIMVWESLTGERFWQGKSELELLGALMRGEFPPFPEGLDVPEELVAIARKATAVLADDRYPTAHAMRLALEGWLGPNEAGAFDAFQPIFAKWFARERAQVSKLIEASATASAEEELPSLAPDAAGSQSLVGAGGLSGSFSRSSSQASASATAHASPPTAVTASQVIVVPPSRAPWVVAGVAVLALAGAGWKLSRKEAPTASTTAPSADSARLTVEVTPPQAQIFVDDALVVGNPFSASYAKGQAHTVRVTAPGFAPKAEHVELTDNVKLKISLDAAQASDAPATPATATGPSGTKIVYLPAKPGAPATVAPTQTATADPKGPLRNVDSSNPYATTGGAGAKPTRGVDSANPYK
jgi:serine/threonine-protein kinase